MSYATVTKMNLDHWHNVRQKRKELGLLICDYNVEVNDHPLLGCKLFNKETETVYVIQDVRKHWLQGWYYVFIVRNNHGSHGVLLWENINCWNDDILKQIEYTHSIYGVVEN